MAKNDNVQILDLEQQSWAEIEKALSESTWMPPNSTMNDWVDNVCR